MNIQIVFLFFSLFFFGKLLDRQFTFLVTITATKFSQIVGYLSKFRCLLALKV